MSEANILNPSAASLFNPLYGWQRRRMKAFADFVPLLGTPKRRVEIVTGLRYALEFELPKTEALQLDQWAQQYENDFFTLVDWERTRYYSGRFAEDPVEVWAGNNLVRYQGVFEELPGLPLNTYPTDWDRDAVFLEERNGLGEDLVKLTGTWVYGAGGAPFHHGGAIYASSGTQDTNDIAEWEYVGYGFRYWSPKHPNSGKSRISATRVRDNVSVLSVQVTDLYDASGVNSSPLVTKSDLPLDRYRVKLQKDGTKNAAAATYEVYADAIQVMR